MEMAAIALLPVGARPVVVGEGFPARSRAAGAVILVPDIVVIVEIPDALVERDFLACRDIAPRRERNLIVEPGICVAGMIEILIEAWRGVAFRQCEIGLAH